MIIKQDGNVARMSRNDFERINEVLVWQTSVEPLYLGLQHSTNTVMKESDRTSKNA